MVRLLNLDEDVDPDAGPLARHIDALAVAEDSRPNPNVNKFTAALSCYPVVSLLASYIDLTTLSDLSQTCRQVRANLLENRKLLISQTLRCKNENASFATLLGNAFSASLDSWTTYGRNGVKVDRITSGKIGACARDMLGHCRKCGDIICRNCVVKSPDPKRAKVRHRRLCQTCMKSPLGNLTTETRAVEVDESGMRRVLSNLQTSGVVLTFSSNDDSEPIQYRTYAREPCSCAEIAWICQPCANMMHQRDTTYERGWMWRTRYSHCGGIGAGLGEGNEGVECGRTKNCLAARMVEKDVECDAAELAALQAETAKAEIEGRHWNGSSYSTQEMVGIGGMVKTKVKKRVPVGAIVKEYEEERNHDSFLDRERIGERRSWCSWCERVVLGKKDLDGAARSTASIASSSSISA